MSHGVPPAGHDSTFLLLPVRGDKKENISENQMTSQIIEQCCFFFTIFLFLLCSLNKSP